MVLVPLLIGFFLTAWVFDRAGWLERAGYTLFFALVVVPFLLIHLSLLASMHITGALYLIVGLICLMALAWPGVRGLRRMSWRAPRIAEWFGLALAAAVGAFSYVYYNDTEFLLSLASYLQRGETKCFPMQTFKLLADLNPGAPGATVRGIFQMISTPGNALFTAGAWPLFHLATFRVLYALVNALLVIFVYLLLVREKVHPLAAGAAALFAAVNPYTLSIEVLDRNVLSLMLSAVLCYTVLSYPKKSLFHGLLWGLAAGVGLRFLHLMLFAPVILLYLMQKARLRDYAWLLLGGAITFAFNIPHLPYQGLHALGENESFVSLLLAAATTGRRTPLVPYANGEFYLLNLFNHWGILISAMALFGLIATLRRDRWRAVALLLIFLPVYLVLLAQRDWLENDKLRILMMGLLPLLLFIGEGLAALCVRKRLLLRLGLFASIVGLTFALQWSLARVDGVPDERTYEKKPVYQRETKAFIDFYRKPFAALHLLPNYRRLAWKTDFADKRREERSVVAKLFPVADPRRDEAYPWLAKWLSAKKPAPAAPPSEETEYVDLLLNLEMLGVDPDRAVTLVKSAEPAFIDLENKDELLDIYYHACDVSWQTPALPIAVLIDRGELAATRRLRIELNALASTGKDEYGFELVNPIHYLLKPELSRVAGAAGMRALPPLHRRPELILRVPRNLTIELRYWIVNGVNGTPYRVDSWRITMDEERQPHLRFYYQEPESYL